MGAVLSVADRLPAPSLRFDAYVDHLSHLLHGRPCGSAEARLYITRRLAGQAQPQLRCAPGTPGGSGSFRAERFRSGAGNTPQ